jgi:hypothetical protein
MDVDETFDELFEELVVDLWIARGCVQCVCGIADG